LIRSARDGIETEITYFNKPVARVVPISSAAAFEPKTWLDELRQIHSTWRTTREPQPGNNARFSRCVRKCYWTPHSLWSLLSGDGQFAALAELLETCKVAYAATSTLAELAPLAACAEKEGKLKPGAMGPIFESLDRAIAGNLVVLVPVEASQIGKDAAIEPQDDKLRQHLTSLMPIDVVHLSTAQRAGCRYIVSASKAVNEACQFWNLRVPVVRKKPESSTVERRWERIGLLLDSMIENRQRISSELTEIVKPEGSGDNMPALPGEFENEDAAKAAFRELRDLIEDDLASALGDVERGMPAR
jgi:antitoxin (DNA-binding transcriptional repressor) of toxin-antitoxin stability system